MYHRDESAEQRSFWNPNRQPFNKDQHTSQWLLSRAQWQPRMVNSVFTVRLQSFCISFFSITLLDVLVILKADAAFKSFHNSVPSLLVCWMCSYSNLLTSWCIKYLSESLWHLQVQFFFHEHELLSLQYCTFSLHPLIILLRFILWEVTKSWKPSKNPHVQSISGEMWHSHC